MQNKLIVDNIKQTEEFTFNLVKLIKPNDIICLKGELGVGKTVIAKAIGKYFNIKENIISPTYNIYKFYDIINNDKINLLNHFDLYRLKSIDEIYDIDFFDIITKENSISIIEWPDIILDLLNVNYFLIEIKKIIGDENKREIIYEYNHK